MRQILVYGDSVAWGIIPGTRSRLPFDERWPGVLEGALNAAGGKVRIVENCLNGRKTVWDDPFRAGRNGAQGLAEIIEAHSPLDLAIVALGTNDFQSAHDNRAWASAQGVARLIDIIRQAPIEPGLARPGILVMAPPRIEQPKGENVLKFRGAAERSEGLVEALRSVADTKSVQFFDVNGVAAASNVDGIHFDADQHAAVGRALAPIVAEAIGLQG